MKTLLKSAVVTITSLALAFGAFIIPASAQQSLAVTCSATPSNANTGQTVIWSAYPTGGYGNYSYTWTGADALSGNGQTTSLTYYGTGQKYATVIVSSNGQTQSATCYTTIGQGNNNGGNLTASCYGNPTNNNSNSITWYVTPMGGNGNYTYSWTGSNGLSGYNQSVTQYYSYSGTQTANVTVMSDGYSYTATCSSNVNGNNNNNGQLNAYCYATPATVNPGETVTWNGSASGGNGNYYYSWTGSNNLYGNNQIISVSYPYGGTQNATLTVTSNGQTAIANCVVNVNGGYYNNNGGNYYNGNGQLSSGVYLSSVPYTGGGANLQVTLFILGMMLWSSFAAFMILKKKETLNS